MTSQNIIIYDFKELFSILEEIKEILKFNLIFVNNTNKELFLDKIKVHSQFHLKNGLKSKAANLILNSIY